LIPPEIVIGVNVVEFPGSTGFVVCAGTKTENGVTARVGVVLALVTEVEQPLFEYSVAVIVKVPPTIPAVTDALLIVAAFPETTTQFEGAVKLAPLGRLGAVSFT
jgi:hypothetical protein